MREPSPSEIAIERVSYAYGRRAPALDGVTLDVPRASILAILGPNGSGKSTLLKLVAQLDRPAAGTIAVRGATRPDAIRGRLGVVFQSPSLDRRLTVGENLRAHAALQGIVASAARARIASLMSTMGLHDRLDVRVDTLSLGLARRVDLARALLHEPDVLLLDEPTAGLDPPSRTAFLDAVRGERDRRGATVVMTTHLVDEADMADRVVLMHRGRVVADGAPGELRGTLGPRMLAVSDDPADIAAEAVASLAWTRSAGGWVAPVPDDPTCARAVLALVAAGRSFGVAPPTLGDLFAKVTGATLEEGAAPAAVERGRRPAPSRSGHALV